MDDPFSTERESGSSEDRKLGRSEGRKLGSSEGRRLGRSGARRLGSSEGRKLVCWAVATMLVLSTLLAAQAPGRGRRPQTPAERASERIRQLQREAEALVAQ